MPDSIIHTDGFAVYGNLKNEGFADHFTVNHGDNEFSKFGKIHTNGIENFWDCAKDGWQSSGESINRTS